VSPCWRQGFTLVHLLAQPEPFVSLKPLNVSPQTAHIELRCGDVSHCLDSGAYTSSRFRAPSWDNSQ